MAQLTEDYCSYELARLLKEKGAFKDIPIQWDCINHLEKAKITHQMAMKWLRSKGWHIKIDHHLETLADGTDPILLWDIEEISNIHKWKVIYGDEEIELSSFIDYEGAVEAAIKYCLTELI